MPKMGLMPMKLLEFCQEVIILKYKNFLAHPFVPLCNGCMYLSLQCAEWLEEPKEVYNKMPCCLLPNLSNIV